LVNIHHVSAINGSSFIYAEALTHLMRIDCLKFACAMYDGLAETIVYLRLMISKLFQDMFRHSCICHSVLHV